MWRIRFVPKNFPHEEVKTPLVKVVKKSREGAPQVPKQEVVSPSDLIVDGASKNEMLLHL
jgi:hypothetical protein